MKLVMVKSGSGARWVVVKDGVGNAHPISPKSGEIRVGQPAVAGAGKPKVPRLRRIVHKANDPASLGMTNLGIKSDRPVIRFSGLGLARICGIRR
jgi:hypothetical protein